MCATKGCGYSRPAASACSRMRCWLSPQRERNSQPPALLCGIKAEKKNAPCRVLRWVGCGCVFRLTNRPQRLLSGQRRHYPRPRRKSPRRGNSRGIILRTRRMQQCKVLKNLHPYILDLAVSKTSGHQSFLKAHRDCVWLSSGFSAICQAGQHVFEYLQRKQALLEGFPTLPP